MVSGIVVPVTVVVVEVVGVLVKVFAVCLPPLAIEVLGLDIGEVEVFTESLASEVVPVKVADDVVW